MSQNYINHVVLVSQRGGSEIPTAIWEQAVAEIDAKHGYTWWEWSADPVGHRIEYRERAELIARRS